MQVGDLCWDIVTESLWIITDIWWNAIGDDYLYDITSVTCGSTLVANETVVTYMRADFIKRTNSVLDKPEE